MSIKHDDIARAAGVDRTTVSRALAGRGRMNAETRDRIRKIAEDLGYRPHRLASSLARGKSDLIGIVMEIGSVSSFDFMFSHIQDEMRLTSYTTIICTHSGRPDLERGCLESLIERRVDGAIAMPSTHSSDPAPYRDLLKSGAKLVLVDKLVEGLEAPHVIADDYQAGKLSTEYLLRLGHTRIAYLAPPPESYVARQRLRGYRDAFEEAGVPLDQSLIVAVGFGLDCGEETMARMLASDDCPTAVIARHDLVGFGALKAVFDAGLSVPEDMSIVGYEDMWCNSILRVPLTTLRHPTDQIGRAAVRLLMDQLAGRRVAPVPTIVGVQLIERNSCAAPRGAKRRANR